MLTKNTISLLVYLESQFVLKDGLINENRLSQADRLTIEHWQEQGLMNIKKLPLPKRKKATHTHKITLTKSLFDSAHKARQKFAERHRPMPHSTKDGKSNFLKAVKNGKAKGRSSKPSKPAKNVDYNHYLSWLEENNIALSTQQEELAMLLFVVCNDPSLKNIITKPDTGQSFIFKTIDQYLTLIKHKSFKELNN
jgi:hypothetical protein